MSNVVGDISKQRAQRIVGYRRMKRSVAHSCANTQSLAVAVHPVESGDLVDVDQMGGLGKSERHDWHQALPAS